MTLTRRAGMLALICGAFGKAQNKKGGNCTPDDAECRVRPRGDTPVLWEVVPGPITFNVTGFDRINVEADGRAVTFTAKQVMDILEGKE